MSFFGRACARLPEATAEWSRKRASARRVGTTGASEGRESHGRNVRLAQARRTGLGGGATPRSRTIRARMAERLHPHGCEQEVARCAPRREVSVRWHRAARRNLAGRVWPAVCPQHTGDVAAFGLEHPGSHAGVRRALRRAALIGGDGKGATAVVTRCGCHRGILRRVRAWPGGSRGRSQSGLRSRQVGNSDARKDANPRTGCRVQQTCER
jgi:hypothetical protein